jgi:hypothetical protein
LSSRCTIPGRATPPIPGSESPQCASNALTSVPSRLLPRDAQPDPPVVDHDQVCVFVYDDKRYFLRLWFGRSGRGHLDNDNLARFDPLVGVSYVWPASVTRPSAIRACSPRPRKLAQVGGKEMVEPPALVDLFGAQSALFLRVRT